MDGTSFFSIIIFSGIIALAIVVGVVSLKFFPKTSLTKAMYVVLGCISLTLGVIGIFLPILPTTPFLLLTLYSFAKGSSRLEQWFLGTKLYQKHLKSFNERRALTKKAKISILTFSTTMLLIGFYFTPSVVGRTIIAILIAVKYWFFFFWIKTEDVKKWIILSLLGLKSAVIFGIVFGLSACDKLNSPKSTNTATDEQPTQSQSIKQENTSKPNRTLLTRAFTHPPYF